MSVIYFVQRESDKAIKIGTTKSIHNRMPQLRKRHGELKLLGLIEGGLVREKVLHWCFQASRIEKEFFEPTPEIMQLIEQYTQVPAGDEYVRPSEFKHLKLNGAIAASGLKKMDVARLCGLSPNTISAWTNVPKGDGYIIPAPTPEKLAGVLKALGWSSSQIEKSWGDFYQVHNNGRHPTGDASPTGEAE